MQYDSEKYLVYEIYLKEKLIGKKPGNTGKKWVENVPTLFCVDE